MQNRFKYYIVILITFYSMPALAYFDPNTGGYIFQLLGPLFAIAMSVWMFFTNQVKAFWRFIRSIFSRKSDSE